MIFDRIENADCYAGMYPKVDLALNEMKKISASAYPDGKLELEGQDLYLLFKEYETHAKESSLFEAHRAYLDVMYMVEGEEIIYVKPTADLHNIVTPYDAAADALLAEPDDDCSSVLLKAGMFVVLLPQDAHAPACQIHQSAKVKKIIGKVRIDQGIN